MYTRTIAENKIKHGAIAIIASCLVLYFTMYLRATVFPQRLFRYTQIQTGEASLAPSRFVPFKADTKSLFNNVFSRYQTWHASQMTTDGCETREFIVWNQIAGLGNRYYSLYAAMDLAITLGRVLVIEWPEFEDVIDFPFKEFYWRDILEKGYICHNDVVGVSGLQFKNSKADPWSDYPIHYNGVSYIQDGVRETLKSRDSGGRSTLPKVIVLLDYISLTLPKELSPIQQILGDAKAMFGEFYTELLIPSERVQKEMVGPVLEKFKDHFVVGMHIRTGWENSLLPWKILYYKRELGKEDINRFEKCYLHFDKTNEKTVLFITSDAQHIVDEYKKKYGDKAIIVDSKIAHVDTASSWHAKAKIFSDNYLLRQSDVLILSRQSSYSVVASYGKKHYFISDSKCGQPLHFKCFGAQTENEPDFC
mmetsp:Transcript_21014/g.23430  ORF Transcript_21014/g.23430 Transcript_21014/m.23430 type:complete len:421 (+) Transcript_21014:91-1353(+)